MNIMRRKGVRVVVGTLVSVALRAGVAAWAQEGAGFEERLTQGGGALLAQVREGQSRYRATTSPRYTGGGTIEGVACINARGEKGFNRMSGEQLRSTKQGECGRMAGAGSLNGANLRYADLRGAWLVREGLFKADLAGSEIQGANLTFADMRQANLIQADLSGTELAAVDLAGAYLNEAKLVGADLSRAHLRGADLAGADLRDSSLFEASLSRAVLRQADLRGAQLGWASFDGADLRRANLEEADLGFAFLDSANLEGARMAGARFNQYTLLPFDRAEAFRRGMVYVEEPSAGQGRGSDSGKPKQFRGRSLE